MASQGHPDLLVLERRPGDSGALRTVIAVEDVRKLVPFLGSTAGEAGWRVVDPLEEAWDGTTPFPYRAGEWGPRAADEMLARDGRTWRRP